MITNEIYGDFAKVKSSLTPGEVKGSFKLTEEGVYLYAHSNGLAEIIEFSSKEAEEAYKARCIEFYNKYFNN